MQYDKRRVSIGYCDNNGELSGLAFQMYLENNIEDYNQPFYMKTL